MQWTFGLDSVSKVYQDINRCSCRAASNCMVDGKSEGKVDNEAKDGLKLVAVR